MPIGESPKWIAVHAFVALGWMILIAVIARLIPEEEQEWLRAVLTAGPLVILTSLARFYATRRAQMGKVETGYLRTALFVISIAGIAGTWHLTVPAGLAFYIWTIVEHRRQRKPPTTARERFR